MNIYFGYTINQNTYAIYIMKKSEKQLEMGYEYNVKSKETTFKTTNIGENKSKMITMHQKKMTLDNLLYLNLNLVIMDYSHS